MSYHPKPCSDYDDRLEAVITCSNYSDFLKETISYNLPHFDRLVVVTGHEDEKTRRLCAKWSVECIVTDVFRENGVSFEKGGAINLGFAALRQKGWILHLDGDIVLPLTFRNMLFKSALQRDCIYGAERCDVKGWDKWVNMKKWWHDYPQFSEGCFVSTPSSLPIGGNLVHRQFGYCPIGYFTLFHSSYMHKYGLRYPEHIGSAEHSDVRFALFWPRVNRRLLPTLRVYHLVGKDMKMGVNWSGRTTAKFGPGN